MITWTIIFHFANRVHKQAAKLILNMFFWECTILIRVMPLAPE